jgi:hypothetical protein
MAPTRTLQTDKRMQARYGCVVRPPDSSFLIEWPDALLGSLSTTKAVIRPIYSTSETGSVLCLALEISPIRFLPRYCYYPFDVSRKPHRTALDSILASGRITCIFCANRSTQKREFQIASSQLDRIKGLREIALADTTKLKAGSLDFDKSVATLEITERLPQYFIYVFPDHSLSEKRAEIARNAKAISQETRALSAELIQGIFTRFRSESDITSALEGLDDFITVLIAVADLKREFQGDADELIQCVSDLVASTTDAATLSELGKFPLLLDLTIGMGKKLRAGLEHDAGASIVPRVADAMSKLRRSLGNNSGPSIGEIVGAAQSLGIKSRLGRPREDYSRAYELKQSGLSWSEVARQLLTTDPRIKEEFRDKTYDQLDYRDQVSLRNRIRNGVRAYLQRSTSNPKSSKPIGPGQ